jgi:hypothetical protein
VKKSFIDETMKAIQQFDQQHERMPTIRDLMTSLDLHSTSTVAYRLEIMEARGLVRLHLGSIVGYKGDTRDQLERKEKGVTEYIDVVMTVLPHHDGEFVETEDDKGRGVGRNLGIDWVDTGDGYHRLRIPKSAFQSEEQD